MFQKHWSGGEKSLRIKSVYKLLAENNIRSASDFHNFAHSEADQGRTSVAEFATRHGPRLRQMIESALNVIEAPQRALEAQMGLMDKLKRAASSLTCCCDGVWAPGAVQILTNNGHDVAEYVDTVRRAFTQGAQRGTNLALVGKGGCGKSALAEPFEKIFNTCAKPQKNSFFPLANTGQRQRERFVRFFEGSDNYLSPLSERASPRGEPRFMSYTSYM